jgi:hypothetical protein
VKPPLFTSDDFIELVEFVKLAARSFEAHEGRELFEDEEKSVDVDLKIISVSASEERKGRKDEPACSSRSH